MPSGNDDAEGELQLRGVSNYEWSYINLIMMANSETGDPILLTPGPLTTSASVKRAMMHDYGSRDRYFLDLNEQVLERLVAMVQGQDSHVAVPLSGSGTTLVESILGSFVPKGGKLLIGINGAYGRRMAKICEYHGRCHVCLWFDEDRPVDPGQVDATLEQDKAITHVAIVHSETTSGILNPLEEIAEVVAAHGKGLLIDSMSAFGAIPLDARKVSFDALGVSSNKCLEGVPGIGFCIARRTALASTAGNSLSLTLDLYDQWHVMQTQRQWRFTPPVQVILALHQALDELDQEGGVIARETRYRANCRVLVDGMREMGFRTLLADALQAPNIVTFHMPQDQKFHFDRFYGLMQSQGFVIYPGKLTEVDSFRMGCIGHLTPQDMHTALAAVRHALDRLGFAGTVS